MNGEDATPPDEPATDHGDGKEKFQPGWLPRSIVIENPADLPRVGVLYASVEGFLKLPLIGGLLVPSVPASNGPAPADEPTAPPPTPTASGEDA